MFKCVSVHGLGVRDFSPENVDVRRYFQNPDNLKKCIKAIPVASGSASEWAKIFTSFMLDGRNLDGTKKLASGLPFMTFSDLRNRELARFHVEGNGHPTIRDVVMNLAGLGATDPSYWGSVQKAILTHNEDFEAQVTFLFGVLACDVAMKVNGYTPADSNYKIAMADFKGKADSYSVPFQDETAQLMALLVAKPIQ